MKLNLWFLIKTFIKTIYVNFHYFPLTYAVKMPIWIAGDVKLGKLGHKGDLRLDKISTGIVRFGFGGSFNLGQGGYFHINGSCVIHGKFTCGRGSQLLVGANADAEFGKNFEANSNCIINAGNRTLHVGDDVILGWGTTVLSANGHEIVSNSGVVEAENKGIFIGNHVWLCSDVKCLSGTLIRDNCVIAANAMITKAFEEENILIGGTNKILKRDINWIK